MANLLAQNLQHFYRVAFTGLIALTFLVSCGDKPTEDVITGGSDAEILNLKDSTVHLFSAVLPLDKIRGKKSHFDEFITIDSNGTYIHPHMFSEGYYFFEFDGFKVKYFIREGKILSMDIDASKPTKKPDFSNKMKYESRYLFDKHMVLVKFHSDAEGYYSLSEKEFLLVVNQLRGQLDKMLVQYITNRPGGSEYFMKQESLSNLYFMATLLEKYQTKHRELLNDQSFTVSNTFSNLTNNLSWNDLNATENAEYFNFLESKAWSTAGYPNSIDNVYSQLDLIDSTITTEDYKDYLLFSTTREVAKWEKSNQRTEVIDSLIYRISDSEIKHFLVQNIQQDTISVVENDSINIIQ